MNLLQLEYFQIVAKEGSFTKAARQLEITQSALSIMMNKLETELGYTLINRQGRHMTLTPYGELLLYYSYILLHEMEDIQLEFSELRGETGEKPIALGVTDGNFDSEWVIGFLEKHPNTAMNILEMPVEEIYHNLLSGNLNFGLVNRPNYHQQLSGQLLFSQPYQLLVLKGHPLAEKTGITIEELLREPLLALPSTYQGRLVDHLSRMAYFKPNIIFEGSQDIMIELFHARIGSILTCAHNRRKWMRLPEEQYVLLNIFGLDNRYEMYLVKSRHRYLSRHARIFQQYVCDYYHA